MFPSNGKSTNQWLTTNSKKTSFKQGKERKGKESKEGKELKGQGERELCLIALYDCLWHVAQENCINKRKWLAVKSMQRCQRNMISQVTIKKANRKF